MGKLRGPGSPERILILGESKEIKKRTCWKVLVGKLQVERRCYVQLIKSFKRCNISCLPLLPFFHFKSEKRFLSRKCGKRQIDVKEQSDCPCPQQCQHCQYTQQSKKYGGMRSLIEIVISKKEGTTHLGKGNFFPNYIVCAAADDVPRTWLLRQVDKCQQCWVELRKGQSTGRVE